MILRVPDYYEKFSCIADKCKDSCCIGWEINIDEDTYSYYKNADGEIGKRLNENIYQSWDGEYSFRLKEHGRCPFLNQRNLCDICIELGEEALSEVCTEYPRFTLDYGNVFQKCLSLSCEEVGRILFSRKDSVRFIEKEQPEMCWDEVEDGMEFEAENETDCGMESEAELEITFLEQVQSILIAILQNREISIWERMNRFLECAKVAQNVVNRGTFVDEDAEIEKMRGYIASKAEKAEITDERRTKIKAEATDKATDEATNKATDEATDKAKNKATDGTTDAASVDARKTSIDSYEAFDERFYIFEQMELLDSEWKTVKEELREQLTQETYSQILDRFLMSEDCHDDDYEQLLVYFTFRYFMQAVYDQNVLSKAKLAVTFTKVIRDMDAVRYQKNGTFTLEDRIDTARIFSKEVEHSQENVAFAEEELEFS